QLDQFRFLWIRRLDAIAQRAVVGQGEEWQPCQRVELRYSLDSKIVEERFFSRALLKALVVRVAKAKFVYSVVRKNMGLAHGGRPGIIDHGERQGHLRSAVAWRR